MFARVFKPAGRTAAGATLVATAATIAALLPATAAFAANTVSAAPATASNDATHTITFTTTDSFLVASPPTVTLTNHAGPSTDTVSATGTVTAGPTPVSGTTVTADLPFTLANPGVYDINISGAGSGGPMTSDTCTSTAGSPCFTVTDANALAVSGASPNEIQASNASASSGKVVVSGGGFAKGTTVAVVDSSNQPVSGISYSATTPNATPNTASTITQIFTVAPGTQPGIYGLMVTNNADGTTAVCTPCFTVAAPMTVSSVTPSALQIGATGKTLTVTGSGFAADAVAKFKHQDATHTDATEVSIGSQSVTGNNTITLSNVSVSNSATPQTLDLSISSASESVTDLFTGKFAIAGPPKPTGVSYDSNPSVNGTTKQDYGQGATAVNLTVHGTGFVADTPDCTGGNGTRVTISPIGGVAVNSECATSTTAVTVNLTLDRTAPTGNRTLTVTNPDGTSVNCNNATNTSPNTCVLAIAAAPTITQPFPGLSVGQTGDITIHGTGFDGQQTKNDISIQGSTVNSVGSASATSVTANVTAGSKAELEDITLSNPSDHGVTTCTQCFSVNSIVVNSALTTGPSPAPSADNSNDATLHVNGANFDKPTLTLRLPGTSSAGTLTGTTQASPAPTGTDFEASVPLKGAEPGKYQVIVTNGGSTPGSGTCSCTFTVKDASGGPTISSVTPSSLPAGSSGQTVVIKGADFYPDSAVSFSFPANGGGQVTVKSVHYDGSQQLTVVVDVASGVTSNQTGTITVTNTDGNNGSSGFTITAAPSVSPVTPSSEPINTTQFTMTFGANNAVTGAQVKLPTSNGGLTAGPTTVSNADSSTPSGYSQKVTTTVSVVPGSAKVGTYDVQLVNPDGGSGTCVRCFSLTAIPPAAPTGVTATAGNQQAAVSWTAPHDNGSRIDSYTITTSPGGGKTTVNAPDANHPAPTSATVTGLTNGTAYTFTVTAHNSAGDSPASAASNSVTPTAKANSPTNVAASAGDTKATVTWTAPTPPGGDSIKDYVIKPNPTGTAVTAGASATSADVTGLTNGNAYTFTVVVEYTSGASADSAPSNSITPFGKPAAPANVAATSSDGQNVTVTWTAPNNNGAAIDSYTVTASPGGKTVTVTGAGSSAPATTATVSGLATGSTYTFTVTAHNKAGDSAPSAASNSVTLGTSGPMAGTTLGLGTVAVHITAGQSFSMGCVLKDGKGQPIPGATVTVFGRTVTGTSVVTTTTTNSSGECSFFPAPKHNTTYTGSYAGSAKYAKATSAPITVTVAPKVTIATKRSTKHINPLVVTGRVSPNKAGKTVTLTAVSSRGVKKTFKATVSGNSTYRFKVKLGKGRWALTVRIGSTSGNTAGRSPKKTITRT